MRANFPAKGGIDHEHEHELATASPSDGRHEEETKEKALILWNATEAWMLRNNEFVRCGEALPAGSTHLIERPLLLEGDRALHFLAFDLPRLRDAFDVRAGEGVRLPEIAPALPALELWLAGTLNSVTGELLCAYGDRVPIKALANAHDQFVFRDPQNADRLLMRNLDAENAAVARLEQIGFARTDAGGFVLHGQLNVVRFFATDYPRLQRDWKVILSAQVEKWTGEIERVTPKLEIVGSGQDWFEVRYSLTTPGGEVFSNADIQRLLRSGQSQTRLKNGHLAVIDTAGLEDFEQVIRDCDPAQTQPGLYRINRAHAAYVEETARELGSAVADRREALKKFITGRDAPPDATTKLGTLAETLREYQLAGFAWLTRLAANNLGGILADEMGLGKTVQTLAFLRAHQGDGPALVVCPTSLVTNWENEARKFTPELKTLVLEGADRAARFKSIAGVDLVITSYALLRRDIDTLREINFSTAVLDEAQHIKNPETQNAQAAYALRATHRFVLTGTPMENSVRDLWSIMNFALPGYLGNRNDFRERYELPIARGSAPDVQRRLSRRLQPFLLRRRKRDVAKDLPEKIEQVVPCSLTSQQRAAYDALLREIQQGLGGSGKNVNAGAQRMKMLTGLLRLRQVCCDLRLLQLAPQVPTGPSQPSTLNSSTSCRAFRQAGPPRRAPRGSDRRRTPRPRLQPVRLDAAPHSRTPGEARDSILLSRRLHQTASGNRGSLPERFRDSSFPDQPESRRRRPESLCRRHRHSFRSVVESRGRSASHRPRPSHRANPCRHRLQADHPRHRRRKDSKVAGEKTRGDRRRHRQRRTAHDRPHHRRTRRTARVGNRVQTG